MSDLIDRQEAMTHWIPCSERLPEVNGRYLVTRGLNACGSLWNRVYIANYSDLMGLKAERIWWNGNVGKSDFERIDDVIAWMPLPEPWERRRMIPKECEYLMWQYCKDPNDITRAVKEQDSNWEGLESLHQIISITYDPNHQCYVVFWIAYRDE